VVDPNTNTSIMFYYYIKHVPKSGMVRGDYRKRKRRKE
jgi:hypothetical protein